MNQKVDLPQYPFRSAEVNTRLENHRVASAKLYDAIVEGVNTNPVKPGLMEKLSGKKELKGKFGKFNDYETLAVVDTDENGLITKAKVSELKNGKPTGQPETIATFGQEGMANLSQRVETVDNAGLETRYDASFGTDGATIKVDFNNVTNAFNERAKNGAVDRKKALVVSSSGNEHFGMEIKYDADHHLSSVTLKTPEEGEIPVNLVKTHTRDDSGIKRNGQAETYWGPLADKKPAPISLGKFNLQLDLLDVLNVNGDIQNEVSFSLFPKEDVQGKDYTPYVLPNIALQNTGFYDRNVEKGELDTVGLLKPPERQVTKVEEKVRHSAIARAN